MGEGIVPLLAGMYAYFSETSCMLFMLQCYGKPDFKVFVIMKT